jgi:predicted cupin superfamily sugar epimerase
VFLVFLLSPITNHQSPITNHQSPITNTMATRSSQLIHSLALHPHLEGGHYREIYRSENQLQYFNARRALLTTIYFLLEKNQVSRWHLVDADEVWHYYEGDALELYLMPPDFSRVEKIMLGKTSADTIPVHVVPAGWWQAAKPSDGNEEYVLCGCTVAPGFEFSGFRFLREDEKTIVSQHHPQTEFLL